MTEYRPDLVASVQELVRERDAYERRLRSAQDSERTLARMVHDYAAERDEARATKDMYKERFEAQQKLHRSDIERARIAGQGQALMALVQEFPGWRQEIAGADPEYVQGFRQALGTVYEWIDATLRELGEEPREEVQR